MKPLPLSERLPAEPVLGTRNYARPSAADVANHRALLEGGELPDTPAPDVECPEFADAEIGVVTRGLLAQQSVAAIARVLGLMRPSEIEALRVLAHEILALGTTDAHPGGRRRSIAPEDEATARVMRHDQHLSIREIAKRLNTTEGSIAWCLANPRPEGEA